jgi:hypothetical protein
VPPFAITLGSYRIERLDIELLATTLPLLEDLDGTAGSAFTLNRSVVLGSKPVLHLRFASTR